jgi:selenocysteine lyase/cysteine desulfurase
MRSPPLLFLLIPLSLASSLLQLPAPLSDFLLSPSTAYHNSATLGACPRVVVDSATKDWIAMEGDPADLYFGGSDTQPSCVSKMAAVRAAAAAFIGAAPNEVALVPSTTVAINAVAEGLVASGFLRAGDVVLQSDQEHMGGRSGFLHYSRLGFFAIDYFAIPMHGSTADSLVSSIAAALTPRTRVVCLSHVTTTTGIRLPIKQIAQLLRPKNILLVVDGAQSAGAIALNVTDLAADVCAAPPHPTSQPVVSAHCFNVVSHPAPSDTA